MPAALLTAQAPCPTIPPRTNDPRSICRSLADKLAGLWPARLHATLLPEPLCTHGYRGHHGQHDWQFTLMLALLSMTAKHDLSGMSPSRPHMTLYPYLAAAARCRRVASTWPLC